MAADVTTRTLRLLTLLQTRARWPAGELARRVGVPSRTLRRDLQRLRSLGYEVRGQPGPGGHYALEAGSRMPPVVFEDDEVVALVTALRVAEQGPAAEAASRALVKLQRVTPRPLARQIEAVAAHSEAVDLGTGPAQGPLVELTAAAAGNRGIRFEYTDQHGRVSHRRVDSARCLTVRRRWYLLAYDLDRDAWRTFLVDRVGAVEAGEPVARREPPATDLAHWLRTDFGRAPAVEHDAPAPPPG